MKNLLLKLGVFILLGYSVFIVMVEWNHGYVGVKHYLTDVNEGKGTFYGLNTTLTTLLLVLSSYNFLLAGYKLWTVTKKKNGFLLFYCIQAIIFFLLAMDERFQGHEKVGGFLGIEDAFVLGFIGLIELTLLYYFKELRWTKTLKSYSLYLGGFFFGLMVLIDAFGAQDGILRISAEDLSKTWAIFFLFLYSFTHLRSINEKELLVDD